MSLQPKGLNSGLAQDNQNKLIYSGTEELQMLGLLMFSLAMKKTYSMLLHPRVLAALVLMQAMSHSSFTALGCTGSHGVTRGCWTMACCWWGTGRRRMGLSTGL